MGDGLRLALTTLTVAPVRGPAQPDRAAAARAMTLAPLVGLGLGLLAATVLLIFRLLSGGPGPPLLAGVLAIATLAALTRGLHLDGLGDLADGLGSYRDPAGARAVMKRPDIGALGLVTVVLVLGIQVAAVLGCVVHGRGTAGLVLSVVTGRVAVVAACRNTPAATAHGLGALVAGTISRGVAGAWALAAAGLGAAYEVVDRDTGNDLLLNALRPVAAVALALLAARVLRRHAVRRVGGLTGDVLGALLELATTVSLVVMSLQVPAALPQ